MASKCDWIGHVLSDVVDFLLRNQMQDSARMLVIAAMHIEHDLNRQNSDAQAIAAQDAKVAALPACRLN